MLRHEYKLDMVMCACVYVSLRAGVEWDESVKACVHSVRRFGLY
jgi:hypothetical protein